MTGLHDELSILVIRPLVIGLSDESATLEVVANQVAVRKVSFLF